MDELLYPKNTSLFGVNKKGRVHFVEITEGFDADMKIAQRFTDTGHFVFGITGRKEVITIEKFGIDFHCKNIGID